MTEYKNISGKSGIIEYEIGDKFIKLRFHNNDSTYLYTEAACGKTHINRMKELAIDGQGLNSYINKNRDVHGCGEKL
ncbi:hypothetical protein L3V83_13120 [Thiotrichales bacterium 19X7-9]|nr:hypothetical protein [Thiotrichales bacterium 19X7-9]